MFELLSGRVPRRETGKPRSIAGRKKQKQWQSDIAARQNITEGYLPLMDYEMAGEWMDESIIKQQWAITIAEWLECQSYRFPSWKIQFKEGKKVWQLLALYKGQLVQPCSLLICSCYFWVSQRTWEDQYSRIKCFPFIFFLLWESIYNSVDGSVSRGWSASA